MAFAIFTDSTANLTAAQLESYNIIEIPFPYFIEETEYNCKNLETFKDTEYYDAMRNGQTVKTSQINPQQYQDAMRPALSSGLDVLFIGISSGISGSFASAQMAREQLLEEFPERNIELVDSLGAGLGEGLLVIKASRCRMHEMDVIETAQRIRSLRKCIYQVFIVDDLMHLKRTGRLSNVSALVGSMLGIKPLLKGSAEGKIIAFEKIRGRKKAIKAMAEKYFTLAQNASHQIIGITYAGCREDAEYLAALIQDKLAPKKILLQKHEPVTGSHIGPGSLALFFEGDAQVRYQ